MNKMRFHLLKVLMFVGFCFAHYTSNAQPCSDPNGLILVTNTNDEGPGSLREAIECANSTLGPNAIKFEIAGTAPHVIFVGSTSGMALSALLDPGTILDARTQSGYTDTPLIVLDGSENTWFDPINAIWVRADFSEVYGFEIRNFPDDGIDVSLASFVTIQENYIHDNGSEVDYFPGAPGTGPWEGCGIVIREGSDQNIIAGNIIENNEFSGVLIRSISNNNLIGGSNPEDANQIKGNAAGIVLGSNCSNNRFQQNSVFCNDTLGISLNGNANDNQLPPVVTQFVNNQIFGTANTGEVIEVFLSDNSDCPGAVCQGRLFLGTTVAVNNSWVLSAPFQNGFTIFGGYVITATATDNSANTSEFSDCYVVPGSSACTQQNGDIIVTNTDDTGSGSLRNAILCANATVGANLIRFEIPGDTTHIIYVGAETNEALPALIDPATSIDGTTQAGFGINGNYSPKIVLDGSAADWTAPINAIWVRGDYCEIYGLGIVNFPDDGIDITNSDYVKIGAVNKGNVIYNNGDEIDYWPDAPGTGPWNGCGIVMKQGSDECEIVGNFVGTDYSQQDTSGNELCGIIIQNGGDRHLIQDNIIANHLIGIHISDGGIRNTLSRNSMYCNDSIPLAFYGNANLNYPAPEINTASNFIVTGVAGSLDIVEVFLSIDSSCVGVPCQGTAFLGTATVTDSTWVLTPPFSNGITLQNGNFITATATDTLGNTSLFSACFEVDFDCDMEIVVTNVMHTSCGQDNGSFNVQISNGTAPYQLDIGMGLTDETVFNNLSAGSYLLIVTDANACTVSQLVTINDSNGPDAFITNINDATCGQDNGSFLVIAIAGVPPYTFDIGDGPVNNNLFENLPSGSYTVVVSDAVGCTTSEEVVVGQSGGPTVFISGLVDETCEQSNGSISVFAIGGTEPYTYDIGDGPIFDPVFPNLSAGTYTITVTDVNACTGTASASIENIGIPPVSDFQYTLMDATVTFINTSTNGITYSWDFGDGNVSGQENPVHSYDDSGDYLVCLTVSNSCGEDTFCELISVIIPLSSVDIGGEIATENGLTVALITVSCTNNPEQVTQIDGQFLFEDQAAGEDFEIVPIKDINYRNGCSTYDVFLLNQHILGMTLLDSPYKIIAGDINNSGTLTTIDALRLQQLVLHDVDTFPNNTSWRFVPTDYVFSNPQNPFMDNFPETIVLNDVLTDQLENDFVAIKIGDLNLNANPANIIEPDGETSFLVEQTDQKDGQVILTFKSSRSQVVSAFEFSLQTDQHKLEFLEVIPNFGVTPNVFFNSSTGILNLSWFDEKGNGRQSEALSFQLKFRTKSDDWQSGIKQCNQISPSVFDLSGKASSLQLIFNNEPTYNSLVMPNPFENETFIQCYLQDSKEMVVRVYDLNGVLVFQSKYFFEKGENIIPVDLRAQPSGVYFYEIGTERGMMVKQ